MKIYDEDEAIKNNCTLCKHFRSYSDIYFNNMEPEDQGFCLKDKNNNYGDSTITCELFELAVIKR